MASLQFEVKDEACSGPLGEYFERYYMSTSRRTATVGQLYLGKSAINSEDALAKAEAASATLTATELGLEIDESYPYPVRVAPFAASVLRMCLRHEEPTIEVVENTVIATSSNRAKILGHPVGHYIAHYPNDPLTLPMSVVYEAGDDAVDPLSVTYLVNYLPHEDFTGLQQDHTGVISQRGGHTRRAYLGLLGGEQVVQID